MAKYKFNDDAVNPVLEELAKVGVKRNKIEYEQILKIQELLKINTYKTIDELRTVRNSVVKHHMMKLKDTNGQWKVAY